MDIAFLDIFFIFWGSALVWVIVEYIFYKINKNSKTKSIYRQYSGEEK